MYDRENTGANSSHTAARKPAAVPRTPPIGLLGLQATAGNNAVVQMLRRAGRLGAQPERHQHSTDCGHQTDQPAVQRSTVHDVLRTSGRPLDEATRSDMESRLGADFTDVRIHDDTAAQASAAEIGARAYTSHHHIVMGAGGSDKHTLAHELTHVIQQRQGPVAGTDNGQGLKVSDPTDRYEREAEANARRAMGGPAPSARQEQDVSGAETGERQVPPASPAAPVQRWYLGVPDPHSVRVTAMTPIDGSREQDVNAFVDSLDRSSLGWFMSDDEDMDTRATVLKNKTEQRDIEDPFTRQKEILYQCASCRRGHTYSGIDIGHIQDWRGYLKLKGVINQQEAMMAYNDLGNLQAECSSCNRSHAFEHNAAGGWNSESESDSSSLDDFIVPG